MNRDASGRPLSVTALMILVGLQGLSGLSGGFGLVVDPSGRVLRIPLAWLEGSPFSDYLVPGVVLFVGLGVVPLFVVYGLWNARPWAWTGSALVGAALVVWILVEISVISYRADPPLQLVYGVLAGLILAITALPSVRDYLRSRR